MVQIPEKWHQAGCLSRAQHQSMRGSSGLKIREQNWKWDVRSCSADAESGLWQLGLVLHSGSKKMDEMFIVITYTRSRWRRSDKITAWFSRPSSSSSSSCSSSFHFSPSFIAGINSDVEFSLKVGQRPLSPSLSLPPHSFFPCNPPSTVLLHKEGEREKRMATRLLSFLFHLLPLQANFLLFPFLWLVPLLCHSLVVWRLPIWLCGGVFCPWAIHHRPHTPFSSVLKFYVKVRPPPLAAPAPQSVQV